MQALPNNLALHAIPGLLVFTGVCCHFFCDMLGVNLGLLGFVSVVSPTVCRGPLGLVGVCRGLPLEVLGEEREGPPPRQGSDTGGCVARVKGKHQGGVTGTRLRETE